MGYRTLLFRLDELLWSFLTINKSPEVNRIFTSVVLRKFNVSACICVSDSCIFGDYIRNFLLLVTNLGVGGAGRPTK